MIKALLFDLDGMLVDTLPLYLKSYRKALKEQGFALTDKEIVNTCFGKTEQTICNNLGIPDKVEAFTKSYFAGVKNRFNLGNLFPGVKDILMLAKEKQIKLGIISFAYRWYIDEMIQRLNLNKYFDCVIGFNDVKNPKPLPEAVLLACSKLKVKPSDVLVIGDAKSDIEMGKSAGAKTVLFHPSNYDLFYNLKELKKSNPDKVISNFTELKSILV